MSSVDRPAIIPAPTRSILAIVPLTSTRARVAAVVAAALLVCTGSDISQYWVWSVTGLRPIDDTNEAYKLGVNHLIYGLTH